MKSPLIVQHYAEILLVLLLSLLMGLASLAYLRYRHVDIPHPTRLHTPVESLRRQLTQKRLPLAAGQPLILQHAPYTLTAQSDTHEGQAIVAGQVLADQTQDKQEFIPREGLEFILQQSKTGEWILVHERLITEVR